MKYAIIIPDGAADEPLKELGGKTPLEAADTPNMDRVAMEGRQGVARTVPDGFESGSDVATMHKVAVNGEFLVENHVLSVDPAARTADVLGMTTYEQLVELPLRGGTDDLEAQILIHVAARCRVLLERPRCGR